MAIELLSKLESECIELTLVNGKLCLKAPKGKLTKELTAEIKAQKFAIISHIEAEHHDVASLLSAREDGDISLSYQQRRLWFIDKFMGRSPLYNMPSALSLKGPVDVHAVKRAFEYLYQRHEALRSYVKEKEGEGYLASHDTDNLDYLCVTDTGSERESVACKLTRLVKQELSYCFTLTSDCLLRVRLFRLADQEYILTVLVHHIVADGWSIGNLINEFAILYKAMSTGESLQLPKIAFQYSDYCRWQKLQRQQNVWRKQLDFWRSELADAPEISSVPTDFPRPVNQSNVGKTVQFELDLALSERVEEYLAEKNITHYMFFMSCYAFLLSRFSHQQEVVLGTVVANRQQQEFEKTVGYFANTLALKVAIDPHQS